MTAEQAKVKKILSGVSDSLIDEWLFWRLVVIEKVAPLDEVENFWCFDDIVRANDVLDIRQAIESAMMPKTPEGS